MMRYLLTLICIAYSVIVSGQLRFAAGEVGPDTLNANETLYQYIGGTSWETATQFDKPGELVILVQADSLSGNVGGTISVEFCLDDACVLAYTAGSLAISGSSSQQLRIKDTNFAEQKVRVKAVATADVQALKYQTTYTFKRAN